jgi:disulfide bond formation protein DsbB
MSWQAVATVLAVLALVADGVVLATLLFFIGSRLSPALSLRWGGFREAIAPFALPVAFIAAAIAMGGSLYFSEVARFTPCKLCWYQRICMYPEVLLLGIAMFRRDLISARRLAAPLAAVGAVISTYHYQLERLPQQPTLSCGIGEPVCSQALFNIFGFVSIPFMALAAFLLIVTMLTAARELEDS